MLERYETINLGTDEELTKSLTAFSKQVNIGMAAQSAASSHNNAVTKAVMKQMYLGYYFFAVDNRVKKAKFFEANPDLDTACSVWNMLD